jgi:alanine dehydrogenase
MARSIVKHGVVDALRNRPNLVTGLNLFNGIATRKSIGSAFKVETKEASEVLA